MDWDGLDAYMVFVEHMNLTKAAREMHISQPALYSKLQRLSGRLGVPLYRRDGRRLVLTKEGEALARFGREQEARTASFLGRLRGEEVRTPVVLAAGEGAYLYLLGEGIKAYLSQGERPLRLLTGGRGKVLQLLRSGEAQLGVSVLDVLPSDMCCTLFMEVGVVLVCPKGHPLAKKERIDLQDLEGSSLVVPPEGRPHRVAVERALMEAGVSWNVAVEAGGWPLMLHFVAMGVGLALVNGSCRIPDDLCALPVPSLGRVRYYLMHREDVLVQSGLASLHQTLLAHVQKAR